MGAVGNADSAYAHVDSAKTAERLRKRKPLFSVVVGGADAKVRHATFDGAGMATACREAVLLCVRVHVCAFCLTQIGEVAVRRHDDPYALAYRFVRDHNLRYEFIVEVRMDGATFDRHTLIIGRCTLLRIVRGLVCLLSDLLLSNALTRLLGKLSSEPALSFLYL